MNIRLLVTYEGTEYFGWQDVGVGPTIQSQLQKALKQIFSKDVPLQAASRTDRGVHAKGQAVNFISSEELNLPRLQRSLNALLPDDITVWKVDEMQESFHPTIDAIGKEYRYTICNAAVQLPFDRFFSWHVPQTLDLEAMQEAAKTLIGEHDFRAFCNVKDNFEYSSYIRTVTDIKIDESEENQLCITVCGNNFLYKMVRNIVGTLVYVGLGKLTEVKSILGEQDRTQAGITAPAHGLTLYRVNYPFPC